MNMQNEVSVLVCLVSVCSCTFGESFYEFVYVCSDTPFVGVHSLWQHRSDGSSRERLHISVSGDVVVIEEHKWTHRTR